MNPFYFAKKAVKSMQNAPLANILAVITIAMSITIFGIVFMGIINANRLAGQLSNRLEVVVYLKDGISKEALKGIEEEIKGFPEVKDVTFISKEDAFISLKKGLSYDSYILDGIDDNPLPASLVVRLRESFQNSAGIKSVTKKLIGKESLEDVQYGGEWLERFSALISMIKYGSATAGIGLTLSIMLIVSSTIRLTIQTRMDEIEVMRLVGATPFFIKMPFMIEGVILGGIGAFFAAMILIISKWFIEYNFGNELRLFINGNLDLLSYETVIGIFSFGMVSGLIGSIFSFWRFSKA